MAVYKNINNDLIEDVLEDCFWGDYNYSAEEIKKELNSGDERFKLFLFSKIINNSRYPSKYIRAFFDEDEVRFFLSKIPGRQGEGFSRRRQLVMANVLGEISEIKGLQWRIQ